MARKRRSPEECVRVLREAAKCGIAETQHHRNDLLPLETDVRWDGDLRNPADPPTREGK